jgi:hypothetical protein
MGLLDIFNTNKTNTQTSQNPEDIYNSAKMELKDLLAPSAVGVESKSMTLSGKIVRSYFVISYPRYLNDN